MVRDAAYYRRHAAEMALVLAGGATSPKEARRKLDALEARERDRAAGDRLAEKMNAPLVPAHLRSEPDLADPRDPQPWMMRD
jgi:hypothetical protein